MSIAERQRQVYTVIGLGDGYGIMRNADATVAGYEAYGTLGMRLWMKAAEAEAFIEQGLRLGKYDHNFPILWIERVQ